MKLGPVRRAYCTNVHAGADLDSTRANLEKYALAVKARVSPHQSLGIGLWLSAAAAKKLLTDRRIEAFAGWLQEAGLAAFTFNGFPFGDFHQPVVKHGVYEPAWIDPARLDYTLDLIAIQHALLPPGVEGTISTLPVAWGRPAPDRDKLLAAARQLCRVAEHLATLETETGRFISLCLEPEPGCVLERSGDVVRFFEDSLMRPGMEDVLHRYLRVCHDICHAAVMFESQEDVLKAYRASGISVGKVQVSSAIRVPWEEIDRHERPAALAQLSSFAEDRYLHQTVCRDSGAVVFFEDLPLALAAVRDATQLSGEWRIHFHVPLYLERFGHVCTTQGEIPKCLRAVAKYSEARHFEVETYAWEVLPSELRQADLAEGIAQEMKWFGEALQS